jgi:hypothetical protein
MAPIRAALVIVLLFAQSAGAAECLIADSDRPLILRGIVEYHREAGQPGVSLILHLESPICIRGVKYGGQQFKREAISSILLGLPAHLNKAPHDGQRAVLRGKIGGPAINDPDEKLTFGLLEIL